MPAFTPRHNPNVYRPHIECAHEWDADCIIHKDQDPVPCAIAPLGCRDTKRMTPLRLYRIRAMGPIGSEEQGAFEIINNRGVAIYCLWINCAHLGYSTTSNESLRWKLVWVPLADLPADLR